MSRIAKVIVQVALNREFEYSIPEALKARIRIGSRVVVPFGKSDRDGFVVGLSDLTDRTDLKDISDAVDDTPLITDNVLRIAKWMADYYCAPIEHAVRAVLPGAVRQKKAEYRLGLFVTPLSAADRQKLRGAKQRAVLELLDAAGGMFMRELARRAGVTSSVVRALEKKGFVSIESSELPFTAADGAEVVRTHPLVLTEEQMVVFETAKQRAAEATPGVILVYGVTGSGKTEIYLQSIQHVLGHGKGAIVLVPEISLTPQTVERFKGRFGDAVAVLHSHLSNAERHAEWYRIHRGEARIVVGARSAIFAPVNDLGLIVVDEEHDTSYKQNESPRYNARDIAVVRGAIEKCLVILGSATPSVESHVNAEKGKYRRVSLLHRVDKRRMPVIRVVDMRIETEREGRVNVFSFDLIEAVRRRLDRGEQTMLFLNRRGYATSLFCPKCGFVAECNLCSIALTYHRTAEELRCHVCGHVRRVPARCPKCSDPAFKFAGIGTQRVEKIVEKLFAKARICRMDSDTTTGKGSHSRFLGDFRKGKIDILIGTQMIAKGLDFPNVTLIGVIHADLSLHLPDFRAAERTFSLLTQVAGRAGRGDIPGEVIVQTFTPHHFAVQAACTLDYEGFYSKECEFRRELKYPPYSHLACITARGVSEAKVSFAMEAFASKLRKRLPERVIISGPASAPLARAKGYYRIQLMLRSQSPRLMIAGIKEVVQEFNWPPKVTCSVDMDAISLM